MYEKIKPCPICHKDNAVVLTQTHYGVPRFRFECVIGMEVKNDL